MKRKICVVITARPSYSRIKTALIAMREHPDIELQLVVAASALLDRYGTVVSEITKDGFTISRKVFMVLEGESPVSMAKTTGLGMMELATTFDNLQPDLVVTIADRYETLATAVAAAYLNIPLAHIQGGEVTGSIDEKVRHSITKLADLHLVSSQKSYERVQRMGEDPAKIFVTGCPSIDLAREILDSPELNFNPIKKYGGVGSPIDISNGYLVVMQHPVTTEYKDSADHVGETLHAVKDLGVPALWFWPNVDAGSDGTSKRIRSFREIEKPDNIHFFKNMAPHDFLRLIHNCKCLIGNSSVGVRESSYLGIPVVNIGSRQNGRERGPNIIDTTYDRNEISKAVRQHFQNGRYPSDQIYGDGEAGGRIAETLATTQLSIEKILQY
ncbi:MAG: UDP-N-acetylglucosamine 2-epimerase [Desulfobulbaceae bacterium]|nr:UDP-N-acetylglucosamine 2-epimerase [Desulfobulbaceae bacterium]